VGPNRRARERERAVAEAAATTKRAEAERKAAADAQKIVAIWNASAGRRTRALVLSDDWRCDQGRAPLAELFVPDSGLSFANGCSTPMRLARLASRRLFQELQRLGHPSGSISSLIPSVSCPVEGAQVNGADLTTGQHRTQQGPSVSHGGGEADTWG